MDELQKNDSPLFPVFDSMPSQKTETSSEAFTPISAANFDTHYPTAVADDATDPSADEQQPKLRTDNVLYKKFGVKERKVINAVYNAIYNAIADEDMREGLIKKIEKELTK